MVIASNSLQTIERVIGNLEPIGITIVDIDGTAINITGSTWTVDFVNTTTHATDATRSASIVSAAAGTITVSPLAADVDTAGLWALYANDDSTPSRRHPYDGARLLLNVKSAGNP